jgi:hypothetical protein
MKLPGVRGFGILVGLAMLSGCAPPPVVVAESPPPVGAPIALAAVPVVVVPMPLPVVLTVPLGPCGYTRSCYSVPIVIPTQ